MCMGILPEHMSVHQHVHTWFLQRPEELNRSPRPAVTECCEPPCWEPNLGPLEEQAVLLIAEPSLKLFPDLLIRKNFSQNQAAHSFSTRSLCCSVPRMSGSNRMLTRSSTVLSKSSLSAFPRTPIPPFPCSELAQVCLPPQSSTSSSIV